MSEAGWCPMVNDACDPNCMLSRDGGACAFSVLVDEVRRLANETSKLERSAEQIAARLP